MKKITKKEILSNVRALMETLDVAFENEALTPDMVIEFCDKEIAALDSKTAKAKERAAAKKAKNYAEADRIRNELAAEGIILVDSPSGTTYKRA